MKYIVAQVKLAETRGDTISTLKDGVFTMDFLDWLLANRAAQFKHYETAGGMGYPELKLAARELLEDHDRIDQAAKAKQDEKDKVHAAQAAARVSRRWYVVAYAMA